MSNFLDFYQKNRKVILGFVWLLAIILIGLYAFNNLKDSFHFAQAEDNEQLESLMDSNNTFSFNVDQLNEVEIILVSEELKIQPTNENKLTVALLGKWNENQIPSITYENGVFSIEQKNKKESNSRSRSVLIKVPSTKVSNNTEFSISNVSGRSEVVNFDVSKIKVENVSGSIRLINVTNNKAVLNNVSGSTKVFNCNINELSANSIRGSIKIDGSFDEVKAETVSGSIKVQTSKDFTRDCEFASISGSVSIGLPTNANAKLNCQCIM